MPIPYADNPGAAYAGESAVDLDELDESGTYIAQMLLLAEHPSTENTRAKGSPLIARARRPKRALPNPLTQMRPLLDPGGLCTTGIPGCPQIPLGCRSLPPTALWQRRLRRRESCPNLHLRVKDGLGEHRCRRLGRCMIPMRGGYRAKTWSCCRRTTIRPGRGMSAKGERGSDTSCTIK